MAVTETKHIIITPAYNEEAFIGLTLESVTRQTLLPIQWIVVDDGSTDNTAAIVQVYAEKFPWIQLVHNNEKKLGHSSGGHVAAVFSFGLKHAHSHQWTFVTKLDADLELPANYFESMASHFEGNKKLGVCGGVCAVEKNGVWQTESITNDDHVRGALKSYSSPCFADLGGLRHTEGWDTLDELIARYHHYDVLADKTLVAKHFKTTDAKTGNMKSAVKSGRSFYLMGYNFPVAIIASAKRGMKPPRVAGFFLALFGYLQLMLKGIEKMVNKDEQKFINRYRWQSILRK